MYIKYNANPKNRKVGDCAIRAVAVANGISWDMAYNMLAEAGYEVKAAMNDIEAIDHLLTELGWSTGTIRIIKGQKRPRVQNFAAMNKDIVAVLRTAGHITCCRNGNYYDTWDCGNQAVYKYWYKRV